MDGIDWLPESTEEWPEAIGFPGFRDIAKGVVMPHTLVEKVLDRGRGGRKVVTHTQPPPVAQNAREVQGQLTSLLRTVKNVEEKLDETTRQLALVQRFSAGSQEADLFRQSLTTAALGIVTALTARNKWAAWAHAIPVVQNFNGFRASIATKPISTFVWPFLAAGVASGGWIHEKIEKKMETQNEQTIQDLQAKLDLLAKQERLAQQELQAKRQLDDAASSSRSRQAR